MKDEIPTFDWMVRRLGVESGITMYSNAMGGSMMPRGNPVRNQARVLQLMGYVGTLDEICEEIYVHEDARYKALLKTGGRKSSFNDPEYATPLEA